MREERIRRKSKREVWEGGRKGERERGREGGREPNTIVKE